MIKSCKDAFNVYLANVINRKLKIFVPEIRLLQYVDIDYANVQRGIERVTRADFEIEPYVIPFILKCLIAEEFFGCTFSVAYAIRAFNKFAEYFRKECQYSI